MYACLAVTCHLHFWQNDLGLLRATAVTRGWNGYRNKSQHRKSTLEKKILPPFQQGFEPATFQSRVRCSNHWAIPAPTRRLCPILNKTKQWTPNTIPHLTCFFKACAPFWGSFYIVFIRSGPNPFSLAPTASFSKNNNGYNHCPQNIGVGACMHGWEQLSVY